MKRYAVIACLVWLWSMHAHAARPPATLVGVVTKVTDGDTLYVGAVKVRLWGIDTPERAWKGRWPTQPGADEAAAELGRLVAEKHVVAIVRNTGRYGRPVVDLYADGVRINLAMVKAGHAWWSQRYAPKSQELKAAEQEAREKKIGVWADDQPIAPWVWRKRRR